MEASIVRFSRPLLIKVDKSMYQTIYGFWLTGKIDPSPARLNQYVGYLCGLHDWSSGGDYFTVSTEVRGEPDWKDKKGNVHIKMDSWMARTGEKCRKKLGLTYDILTVNVDEEEFLHDVINEDALIVNEEFYYDIQRYLEAPSTKESPLWDDDLPF